MPTQKDAAKKKAFDIDLILAILAKEVAGYKVPVVDLIAVQSKDPFQVLVATILSARTKDETTAGAAVRLFNKASDLESLAALSEEEIARLIYPVGFYRNKAGYLAKLPEAIAAMGGVIPDEVETLTKLPGVGRKTANLVVSVAFHKPAICVDTHVHRIMNIWGYVLTKTPLDTEMALRGKLPEKHWLTVNSILVAFGQGTCRPISPHCDRCVIQQYCPQIGVTPRRVPCDRRATPMEHTLKLLCWNVNGIRAVEKKGFVELVQDLDPDILAVQETKVQEDQLSDELKNIKGYQSFWHCAERKGYSGVAVYSRMAPVSVRYGMNEPAFDNEGRVLTLEFTDFFLINCYFPNAAEGLKRLDYKLAFNRALQEFAQSLAAQKSVVLCGDYNVAHQEIDLKNPKSNEQNAGFTPEERSWLDSFLAAGFVDSFRMFNAEGGHYTWWSYRFNARAKDIGWRIDYFCVDEKSRHRVQGAAILKDVMGSDHCPVQLDFK
ncbi:MAG: exodeoxyribonuclease III [Proteobacteria bacterium]|nr:exodeoxyribonuclease III [Pseudomonadota bacterium]MBU4295796.1 exodeoxyribonuclease III [Pseudomonadota bacterium]MCG2747820.1 exodeoxyribonuclease III [Desulfobulbaceae bacterium]